MYGGEITHGDMRVYLEAGCAGCRHGYRCAAPRRGELGALGAGDGCLIAASLLALVDRDAAREAEAEARPTPQAN